MKLLPAALCILGLYFAPVLEAQYYCTNGMEGNLVPNPGFETYSSCPDDTSEVDRAVPWFQPTFGTSDYFNPCSNDDPNDPYTGVPSNFAGTRTPHGGQAYAGGYMFDSNGEVDYREYIETPLVSPLVPGHTYAVSFWVAMAPISVFAVQNIGAYFSAQSITAPNSGANLPVVPQVENTAGFLTSEDWVQIQGQYTAGGGEYFITIGNFYDDANTALVSVQNYPRGPSYYYIDDVAVVDTTPCSNTCASTSGCLSISNPNDIVVFTCSNSMPVNYDVGVTDGCCSSCVTWQSIPPSGYNFPLGTTTVTTGASDTLGNTNSCSFTVTVVPYAPPVIDVSSFGSSVLLTNCLGDGCAEIPDLTYQVSVITATGGLPDVYQSIAPQTEVCGNTNITFYAIDGCGNTASVTLPVIDGCLTNTCDSTNGCLTLYNPNDIVELSCSNSLAVNYSVWVTDDCCANCDTTNSVPPSGYNFPLGTTLVTSTATDSLGDSVSCSFTVTVEPYLSNPIVMDCPSNIVITSCTNFPFDYPTHVFDPCCPDSLTVTFDPPSGYAFAPGTTTTVNCVAMDACGHSNECSFPVTVICPNCYMPCTTVAGIYTNLHTFSATTPNGENVGYNVDGAKPNNGVVLSGQTLYGTALWGGANTVGTVFSVNTDGTGFAALHEFDNAGNDPFGGLVLVNGILYGTADADGSDDQGILYSIHTDGTHFAVVHNFAGGTDGSDPFSPLMASGNIIYGVTSVNVFSYDTSGPGYSPLFDFFSTGANYGTVPSGLVLVGNTLYGTMLYDGAFSYGTIFSIQTDGTGMTVLHNFAGPDGAWPSEYSAMVSVGNILYGTTSSGGAYGFGTVFAYDLSSAGFSTVYNFTGGYDGGYPEAALIASGGVLYGTASDIVPVDDTSVGDGTVFSMNPDGTGFTVLYSFTPPDPGTHYADLINSDGANPFCQLVLSGNNLYGTAQQGGAWGNGTVFGLTLTNVPTNCLQIHCPNDILATAPSCTNNVQEFYAPVVTDLACPNYTLVCTPPSGTYFAPGTVTTVDCQATDCCGNTASCSFTVTVNCTPPCLQVQCATNKTVPCGSNWTFDQPLATSCCGTNMTIEILDTVTNGTCPPSFTRAWEISDFCGHSNECMQTVTVEDDLPPMLNCPGDITVTSCTNISVCYNPTATDSCTGANLQVTCVPPSCSEFSPGTTTQVTCTTSNCVSSAQCTFNVTVLCNDTNGQCPCNGLGGAATTTFDCIYRFPGTLGGGDGAIGGLVLSGNDLYGTTMGGGSPNYGTVYTLHTDGTGINILHKFSPSPLDGNLPLCTLALSGSTLYGTTTQGGASGAGSVFSLSTSGSGFTLVHSFNGNDGAAPYYGPLLLSGGNLYGTTTQGGSYKGGTVFSVPAGGGTLTTLYNFSGLADGKAPYAGVILSQDGSTLYGTTSAGGASGQGTVFSLNIASQTCVTLYGFSGSDGSMPLGALALSPSGDTLYGTTLRGGTAGEGTVFSLPTIAGGGATLITLHDFTGSGDGVQPCAGVTLSGNVLYGTASGYATIFTIDPGGYGFKTLHTFVGAINGYYPTGPLVLSGNTIYGTTAYGGLPDFGTVFTFYSTNLATNCFSVQCPNDIDVTNCGNVQEFYAPTVTDYACPNWTVVCTPPSGSSFAPGTVTTVDCTVTDCCGNTATCSFTVTVHCKDMLHIMGGGSFGHGLLISWPNVPFGFNYYGQTNPFYTLTNWQVQSSTDLLNWQTTGTVSPFVIPITNQLGQQFFRLVLAANPVPAGGATYFEALTNTPLGNATLQVADLGSNGQYGLIVTNLGSSGQDGVSVTFPNNPSNYTVAWQPLDCSNTLPVGAWIEGLILGTSDAVSNGVVESLTVTKVGVAEYDVTANYPDSATNTFTVSVYNGTNLLLSRSGLGGILCTASQMLHDADDHARWTWPSNTQFLLSGGRPSVQGDTLVVTPTDNPSISSVSGAQLLSSGIPQIVLTRETTPGYYTQLQVLLPGETNAPYATTGKTGTPAAGNLDGNPYVVTVLAVDANFNPIPGVTNIIALTNAPGSDPGEILPVPAAMVNGSVVFDESNPLYFQDAGLWIVTAVDLSDTNIPPAMSTPVQTNP